MTSPRQLEYTLVVSSILVLICAIHVTSSIDPHVLKDIRDCLGSNQTSLCLKEKALYLINDTIHSAQNINLFDVVTVVKDPEYVATGRTDPAGEFELSSNARQRSLQLNSLIAEKIDDLLTSRVVQFKLAPIVEGRGKKDKKGGMLMMGGLAMAGMMAQMFMGKIAFMAGAALLVAKLALLLSTIIGFKKLSGGGSTGEQHVVYTTSSDSGGGHSHGGGSSWHRSMETTDGAGSDAGGGYMAFRAYTTPSSYAIN